MYDMMWKLKCIVLHNLFLSPLFLCGYGAFPISKLSAGNSSLFCTVALYLFYRNSESMDHYGSMQTM
jgi:hypothetical protein